MKRHNPITCKSLLCFFLLLCLMILPVSCGVESVDSHYATESNAQGQTQTAILSITCKTVLDNWDDLDQALKESGDIPKDGVILKETSYPISDGDTVFDLLKRAAKAEKIHLEYQGGGNNAAAGAYIEGINFLYEFSCGEQSGWFFSVNGKFLSKSSSDVPLKDGDRVEWIYSCDLGHDIGAALESG